MDPILDYEEPEEVLKEGKRFRPLAMVLEGLPFFVGILGLWLSFGIVIISFMSLSFIYLGASWYLFKGAKFTAGTIIYAMVSGIILSIATLALLFFLMSWGGKTEMGLVAEILLILGLFFSVIWYGMCSKKHFEFTLSLKLIARFILFLLLIFLMPS